MRLRCCTKSTKTTTSTTTLKLETLKDTQNNGEVQTVFKFCFPQPHVVEVKSRGKVKGCRQPGFGLGKLHGNSSQIRGIKKIRI